MHLLSLASTPKECVVSTNWSLLLLQGESHSGLLSHVSAEFSINKTCFRLWSIWRTILSTSVPTFREPIVKGTTFVFFLCVCISWTANRDLADRDLLARGSKQAFVFLNSIICINSRMDCYLSLITELLYHKQKINILNAKRNAPFLNSSFF